MQQTGLSVIFPRQLHQKYIIERQIGEGAYGSVWKGYNKLTKQPVAIKGFFDIFRDHVDAKRILREISILRQILDHRYIVKLIDVICPDNFFAFTEIFIVMEYCPYDLKTFMKTYMKNHKMVPLNTIRHIMFQILSGLKVCKEYQVVHRDMKPANILLSDIENEIQVKLCDFGLARDLSKRYCKVDEEVKMSGNTASCPYAKKSPPAQIHIPKFHQSQILQPQNVMLKKKQIIPCRVKTISTSKGGLKQESTEKHYFRGVQIPGRQNFSNIVPHTPTEFRKELQLCLTRHLVTRWYRPPEIILIQDYDFSADIWSAGCIFAELLGLTYGAALHGPLFPGKSCYPMSPVKKQLYDKDGKPTTKEIIVYDAHDQLNLIFNMIGTPSENDIGFIKKEDKKAYVRNFGEMKPAVLQRIYPEATVEAIDLLENMLRFNPQKRYNIEQCLSHQFFSSYRNEWAERLGISLDYENTKFHLSSNDIRALILREVNYFNKIEGFDLIFGFLIHEITQSANY